MEWLALPLGLAGMGVFAALLSWGQTLSKRSDDKVRIQELKTEEARELRLKAEAERDARMDTSR